MIDVPEGHNRHLVIIGGCDQADWADATDTAPERRLHDRRIDMVAFKLVSRALLMRRAFGADTALALMRRMNIDAVRAHEILSIRVERRLRRRRGA